MKIQKLLYLLCFSVFGFTFAQNEFITIWKPNETNVLLSSNNGIFFPGIGTNYAINWEEVGYPQHNGSLNNVTSTQSIYIDFGNPHNPNPSNATYRVKVSNGNGSFNSIKFGEVIFNSSINNYEPIFYGEIYKIKEIEQWGNISWTTMNNAFSFCYNLQLTATDIPNLSQVTDLSYMFYGVNFTGHPSMMNWNVSSVNNFRAMFSQYSDNFIIPAGNFNINLSSWNMSNATDISYMFRNQKLFNQPIGNWDTSNVTNMSGVFGGASAFNQDITNWDTSIVTNMSYMFIYAEAFNQPIGNWNTAQVTSMKNMFSYTNFNQPIGNWNTGNVNNFQWMFSHSQFNQPIETWNMSSATDLSYMFLNAANFNQPIGSWNMANVQNMRFMFGGATDFNQALNNWNTGSVTIMDNMFTGAISFNQPLNNWNTSNVTRAIAMFQSASSFNQNLGSWNLSSLILAMNMLSNSGLDCQNYNSTLIGWANSNTHPNINLGSAYPLMYSTDAANTARQYLIQNKGWVINGDLFSYACNRELSTSESNADDQIILYPNPVTDLIFIKSKEKITSAKIYDAAGRLIEHKTKDLEKIDVKHLQNGIYFIELTTADSIKKSKFIKK